TMNYQSFRSKIGEPNHVIIYGWPAGIPCTNPSNVGSRNNMKIVIAALESGIAGFRKLSDEEWKVHETERRHRIEARLEQEADTNEQQQQGNERQEDGERAD
ncbi:hypothetical protein FOMPIDRAFT_32412, partial [Fomitopsis schrenkii]